MKSAMAMTNILVSTTTELQFGSIYKETKCMQYMNANFQLHSKHIRQENKMQIGLYVI